MNEHAPRIRHELEAIKSYLLAAQDVVKTGHMPELEGLENRIARLCESIQGADPETQQTCLPELFTLIDHLNACEKAMRESRVAKAAEDEKS
jgi:hypothetical protein